MPERSTHGGAAPDPLVRSFDEFAAAQLAREALLAAGWPEEAVMLRVIADEAGPVEGNFLVGNGREVQEDTGGSDRIGGLGIPPYDANFEQAVFRGVHLLLVAVRHDDDRERAEALLAGMGATPAGGPAPT